MRHDNLDRTAMAIQPGQDIRDRTDWARKVEQVSLDRAA
jgi:hypothetical protein